MLKQVFSGLEQAAGVKAVVVKATPAVPATVTVEAIEQAPPIPDVALHRSIVFSGSFELLNAQWALDSGRTVDLRIVEEPGHDKVNPFKQYQRKRAGRVGQSFHAVIVADGDTRSAYDGPVMLAGWGDSSDKGQWVRWWLDEESALHPFAGFTRRSGMGLGKFFAAVVALTVEPGGCLQDAHETGGDKQPAPRKLSADAHLIVTSQRFGQWLEEKCEYTTRLHEEGRKWDAQTAKKYVKWKLKVESLSDLDRIEEKAEQFHKEFRIPYSKWNGRE